MEPSISELMELTLECMANLNLPVVFKGAMVLRYLVKKDLNTEMNRSTRDIDMDWCKSMGDTVAIENMIKSTICKLGVDGMTVEKTRDFSAKTAGGFTIKYNGQKLFSIDVSIRDNPFFEIYYTNNNVAFFGASRQKIIIDKIYAISTNVIFRRSKDLYDLALLSNISNISYNNLLQVMSLSGRCMGDFKGYLSRVTELEHAYNKLEGIDNKPEFGLVYGITRDFMYPFIMGMGESSSNPIWQPNSRRWS